MYYICRFIIILCIYIYQNGKIWAQHQYPPMVVYIEMLTPNLGDWLVTTRMTTQWLFLVPLKGGRWHIIPQLVRPGHGVVPMYTNISWQNLGPLLKVKLLVSYILNPVINSKGLANFIRDDSKDWPRYKYLGQSFRNLWNLRHHPFKFHCRDCFSC